MRTILWTSAALHSAEYFTFSEHDGGYHLRGTINLLLENQPTQIVYHIDCDLNWITRRVDILQRQSDRDTRLVLTVDSSLNWYRKGVSLPWAARLTDIDLSITPSTNMLPLRKYSLQIGQSCEVCSGAATR